MPTIRTKDHQDHAGDVASYEALRKGGAPSLLASRQLALSDASAARLEAAFQARTLRSDGDAALPRFARHDRHVAAVIAHGGFPAFSERRIGRHRLCVCLPVTRPNRTTRS